LIQEVLLQNFMPELAAYLFLISLLIMGLVTPLVIRLGRRFGFLDRPGPRKIHSEATPLSGGWAIMASLSIVLWGHLFIAIVLRDKTLAAQLPYWVEYFVTRVPQLITKILPVYFGAVLIFLLGLVDDARGMSVRTRLVFQLAIAAILSVMGIHPNLYFVPTWISCILGAVWIVGITNAFNFLDGLDGLSSGVGLVATLALLTIMGFSEQPNVVFFLAAFSGTLLGFLRYNFHPAKVFLGSSGSLLLGYLLGVFTIVVTYCHASRHNWLMPLLTPVFVLAIPIYDSCSVVLIRLLQRRPVGIGDQSHFHHRLLRLGFSHRQTVIFIVLIAVSVALSGVRLVEANMGQSLLILLQIVGIMAILVLAERVAYRKSEQRIHAHELSQEVSESSDATPVADR
jgi:UDP-GlcNAc:undecaprenyl-phosphate GlcNAc-1-phosphate transferase